METQNTAEKVLDKISRALRIERIKVFVVKILEYTWNALFAHCEAVVAVVCCFVPGEVG